MPGGRIKRKSKKSNGLCRSTGQQGGPRKRQNVAAANKGVRQCANMALARTADVTHRQSAARVTKRNCIATRILSRRDGMKVARYEVPGTRRNATRPGYGMRNCP
jgi:hypothetical protein